MSEKLCTCGDVMFYMHPLNNFNDQCIQLSLRRIEYPSAALHETTENLRDVAFSSSLTLSMSQGDVATSDGEHLKAMPQAYVFPARSLLSGIQKCTSESTSGRCGDEPSTASDTAHRISPSISSKPLTEAGPSSQQVASSSGESPSLYHRVSTGLKDAWTSVAFIFNVANQTWTARANIERPISLIMLATKTL